MKYRFRRKAALLILGLSLMLTSCGKQADQGQKNGQASISSQSEERKVMTERQKKILSDAGLPQDEAALTDSQRQAVFAIEEMLTYLEDSYGETFLYKGYVPESDADQETLFAVAQNDTYERTVTVTRFEENGKRVMKDNYQALQLEEEYQKAVEAHLKDTVVGDKVLVQVRVDELVDAGDDASVIAKAGAYTSIYVENCFSDEAAFSKFIQEYADWMLSENCVRPAGISFTAIPAAEFKKLNRFNVADQLYSGTIVYRAECSIRESGQVKITGV